MSLVDQITEKLKAELAAQHVEIIDNTWRHAGHAGAAAGGAHLHITVVSPRFDGVNLLEQHRMVHRVLQQEMAQAIHAMELVCVPASAWQPSA
jgi:BolA protein